MKRRDDSSGEIIRLSLRAAHADKLVDFALDKLGKAGKGLGLI
jgi:hypothetical protein